MYLAKRLRTKWYFLAPGPHRLDLGDILYAPNAFVDGQGRTLMLAWLQELRKGGGFDYAGCLSLPRVLNLRGAPYELLPNAPFSWSFCTHAQAAVKFIKIKDENSCLTCLCLRLSDLPDTEMSCHSPSVKRSYIAGATFSRLGQLKLHSLKQNACSQQRHFCAGGRLHQEPAPELDQLRQGPGVQLRSLSVEPAAAAALPDIRGPSVDVSFRLARGASSAAGILLRAWLRFDADSDEPCAAAAEVNWDASTLEVCALII